MYYFCLFLAVLEFELRALVLVKQVPYNQDHIFKPTLFLLILTATYGTEIILRLQNLKMKAIK
jgi:hypothetical protein